MPNISFRIISHPDQVNDLIRAFQSQVGPTRAMLGCLACSVEQDSNNPGAIRFSSEWDSEERMKSYLLSDIVTRILQILEMSLQEPEILINAGDARNGLKRLAAIRTTSYESGRK